VCPLFCAIVFRGIHTGPYLQAYLDLDCSILFSAGRIHLYRIAFDINKVRQRLVAFAANPACAIKNYKVRLQVRTSHQL